MKQIIFFIAVILIFASCETKNINLYPSFKECATIPVDETGSFIDNGTISASQIISVINDLDLDETGEIKSVILEGIWLEVEPLSKNTAESVELDLLVSDWSEGYKFLLEGLSLNIPDETTTFKLPKYLIKAGVLEVKSQLSSIVVDKITNNDIYFVINGNAIPEGSIINLNIKVYIKGAVVFTQTVDFI